MTKLSKVLLLGVSIMVIMPTTACTNAWQSQKEIDALNTATPAGDPFTQSLTGEYQAFVDNDLRGMREYPDAAHFARKGLAASRGEKITPEPISDWNLEQGVMAELSDGRSRLLTIFDLGGREIAPQESAFAQAKFDCWIEAQEEVGSEDTAQECKAAFFDALKALESKIQRPAPAVTEEAPAPALEPVTALPVDNSAPLKAEDAMYLVFFDFDSSTVAGGGDSVLNSVVEEIKARGLKNIKLIGHADTSGSDEYNDKLAMKRAQSVKDALIKRGISTGITLESRGESELLVETSDGVREPANRRVQIMFSE